MAPFLESCTHNSNTLASSPLTNKLCYRKVQVDDAHVIVRRLDELSSIEQASVWYSAPEYEKMFTHAQHVIDLKRQGLFHETDEDTFRGLEQHLKRGYVKRVRARAMAYVLQEQRRQMARKVVNADRLAEQYQKATDRPRTVARCLGEKDAQELCLLWQDGGSTTEGERLDTATKCDNPSRRLFRVWSFKELYAEPFSAEESAELDEKPEDYDEVLGINSQCDTVNTSSENTDETENKRRTSRLSPFYTRMRFKNNDHITFSSSHSPPYERSNVKQSLLPRRSSKVVNNMGAGIFKNETPKFDENYLAEFSKLSLRRSSSSRHVIGSVNEKSFDLSELSTSCSPARPRVPRSRSGDAGLLRSVSNRDVRRTPSNELSTDDTQAAHTTRSPRRTLTRYLSQNRVIDDLGPSGNNYEE